MSSQKGFTLLEVMLAVAILAILTTLTASNIQRSLKVKKKLQADMDIESSLRNAMRLIERDINSAFHYRDLTYELKRDVEEAQRKAAGDAPPGAPGSAAPIDPALIEAPPKNLTQFMGAEDSVHFTSLNHIRMMKDAKESDQEEVGYFLESCRSRKIPDGSTTCLMRRTSPIIDDDVSKGGASIALLEGVKTFKLKYIGKGKEDWASAWRSDEGGDDATRDKFPEAVEVSLQVEMQGREFGVTAVFPIHFPNNRSESKSEGNSTTP